jgi:hypothetical protein
MFTFTRPLAAVLAGLAVALLIVTLDGLCESAEPAVSQQQHPEALASACAPHQPCGIVRAGS